MFIIFVFLPFDSSLGLEDIESQLYLIEKLKRSYGPELVDVLEKYESLKEEIFNLKNADQSLEKMQKELLFLNKKNS